MLAPIQHTIDNNSFWLSTERCMFWEEEKCLILSDPHFGKTGHFRKSGIAVPQQVYKQDLQRLFDVIQFFKPIKIIIVGDLFHSKANKELKYFIQWRSNIMAEFILIKGNHDILKNTWYQQHDIQVHENSLQLHQFCFTHHPQQNLTLNNSINYTFTGHIHPGIRLNGVGKQSLHFPCFFFCQQFAVLPAFSHFTGVSLVQPCKFDTVYAIIPPDLQKGSLGAILKV